MRQIMFMFAVLVAMIACKTTKAPLADQEVISEANPAGESSARLMDDDVPAASPSPAQ